MTIEEFQNLTGSGFTSGLSSTWGFSLKWLPFQASPNRGLILKALREKHDNLNSGRKCIHSAVTPVLLTEWSRTEGQEPSGHKYSPKGRLRHLKQDYEWLPLIIKWKAAINQEDKGQFLSRGLRSLQTSALQKFSPGNVIRISYWKAAWRIAFGTHLCSRYRD